MCGGPYETDVATAPWSRQDKARARQLLAEAGYRGEPIVVLDPGDQPVISTIANVTAGLLREIGVPADDPRIQKGVAWLKSSQRVSGRW